MAAIALLLFTACAQPAGPPATTGGGKGSEVPPRVIFPDGYAVHVELATDDATRAQGLMYRDRLRDHTGMLFFFSEMSVHGFWMKNTLIPLDILWIDEGRRVGRGGVRAPDTPRGGGGAQGSGPRRRPDTTQPP